MASSRERGDRVVVLIGAFKLLKSALLIAIGAAALWGVPAAALDRALHASRWTGALSGHRTVRDAVVKLLSMDAHTMRDLGVACLCYAAVFLIEGVGLLRGRRWAEWLTVVVTVSFMPVEIVRARPAWRRGRARGAGDQRGDRRLSGATQVAGARTQRAYTRACIAFSRGVTGHDRRVGRSSDF